MTKCNCPSCAAHWNDEDKREQHNINKDMEALGLIDPLDDETDTLPQELEKQPRPQSGMEVVWVHVKKDIEARAEFGRHKHNGYLRTFNGRDALADAYQEAIDTVIYLKQAIMERDK